MKLARSLIALGILLLIEGVARMYLGLAGNYEIAIVGGFLTGILPAFVCLWFGMKRYEKKKSQKLLDDIWEK